MRAQQATTRSIEKGLAGWIGGCNSVRNPWLLADSQYIWGVNVINRGGLIQTRYGYRQHLTLPDGKLQGYRIFDINKSTASVVGKVHVFAVDGYIYYAPYPLNPIENWEKYKLPNIRFNPNADNVYFEVAEKSLNQTTVANLTRVPSYRVLVMQDGETAAAFWDGEENRHLDQGAALETPIGTWMKWAGQRLWIAKDNAVLAGDLADPLKFTERVEGTGRGDFRFSDTITGLAIFLSDNRQSDLMVFCENETSILKSSIITRDEWEGTQGFQSILYPNIGCISGRSVVSHSGLLWWYSNGGLVSSDSATTSFLTSQVRFRDIEMARSKVNFSNHINNIAGGSFESYLIMSVPSGDDLNAHTMVLDFAIADELMETAPPAWQGVWTGIRPIEWQSDTYGGARRCFCISTDYQAITGETSKNHLWEAFRPERYDSYYQKNLQGEYDLKKNRVYWSAETKTVGDGLDRKAFKYAEIDLIELGDSVDLKLSYFGTRGIYRDIQSKTIEATLDPTRFKSTVLNELYSQEKSFRPQTRRIKTQEEINKRSLIDGMQSEYMFNQDKAFGIMVQGCGRCAIEAMRIYVDVTEERPTGTVEKDETGIKVLLMDGQQFELLEDT